MVHQQLPNLELSLKNGAISSKSSSLQRIRGNYRENIDNVHIILALHHCSTYTSFYPYKLAHLLLSRLRQDVEVFIIDIDVASGTG